MYTNNSPMYSESWVNLDKLKRIILFSFNIRKPATSLAEMYKLQKNH